ncbi:hypothetical protein GXW74_07970 [Roseomonas eburnea]|uniref:Uncharacterized protein n=1 Tax=Neoroseomonas eburnea TaxID=1346889 RepID=A0A9X9X9N4_9PROT|nr:hypothetical protein [Neoroseomonas eburnea]MBR0680420.1 hypothetical protein [Neoroseomonas eburnea]
MRVIRASAHEDAILTAEEDRRDVSEPDALTGLAVLMADPLAVPEAALTSIDGYALLQCGGASRRP